MCTLSCNLAKPVIISDYNPRWPLLYEEEQARILGVIGNQVVAVEHVGSTAVPGLGAKPTIDIMVAVRQLADAEKCIEPLKSIGYTYHPEHEDDFPERRYFDTRTSRKQMHHLHMVEQTSDFWERHLLFRDFLRERPDVARQYHELKKKLAGRYGADRNGYTDAKTSFITSVEDQARAGKAGNSQ